MRSRELALLVLLAGAARAADAPSSGGQPFDFGALGGGNNRKEPINITADSLEYDYKANVVTYRGNVVAIQGDVKVKSDVMVIVLVKAGDGPSAGASGAGKTKAASAKAAAAAAPPAADPAASDKPADDESAAKKPGGKASREKAPNDTPPSDAADPGGKLTLQTVTCTGNVRIDQPPRWATGGVAVFDQTKRTFVLTQKPVLHENQNEISGDRVVVYLDENRSVVEGGPNKRVQAILYPDKGGGLTGDGATGKGGAKSDSGAAPVTATPTP